MSLHHARLDSFTPVTEFSEMLFPSAIAFLLAWLLLTIWLRERERAREQARERQGLLEQISSVEAEYEKLGDEHHNLRYDYRRLRSSHEKLHHEMAQKERNLNSHRAAILLAPPPTVDPPRASWDPPPAAPKSWANSYQALYHSFFPDERQEDWERGLRDDGLDIRRVGVRLLNRSETEEAGVYPISDDPGGNFYLLTDSRAQLTYVLPAPWVQFNSRILIQQLEPFYLPSHFGSGAIERILDPARITSIGDPRWRVEQKGQIQFKGSANPPIPEPPGPDPAEPVLPEPIPVACSEPRRCTNLPPAADTWVPNYLTLYNSYDAGWTSEAWEEALETGGIDFRRVEVSLLPEETGFLLPEDPHGSFYILTDAHSSRDYYLVPAPWVQINSITLMQQIRAFFVCPNMGSGRVASLLEAAQVARGRSSWRVQRRGRIQFMASTNIPELRSQRLRPPLKPTVDSAQLLQQPTLWSVSPEVSEHCPLLPSFPQPPTADPPPHPDSSAEVICETASTPDLSSTRLDPQAEAVVPLVASVDPPPILVPTVSKPSEEEAFTSLPTPVTLGPEAEPVAPSELESSPQNVPHATNTALTKEPASEGPWELQPVATRTDILEVAVTKPPLSERLGPPPQTPDSDEGTLKPAELLSRYRMVALKIQPSRLDHSTCERVMVDAFDELNLAISFSGVTFIQGIQDEVQLDKASRDFAVVWVGPECFLLPLPWLDYVDPDPPRSRALRALFDRHELKDLELLGPAVLCQQSHHTYRVVKKGQVRF